MYTLVVLYALLGLGVDVWMDIVSTELAGVQLLIFAALTLPLIRNRAHIMVALLVARCILSADFWSYLTTLYTHNNRDVPALIPMMIEHMPAVNKYALCVPMWTALGI